MSFRKEGTISIGVTFWSSKEKRERGTGGHVRVDARTPRSGANAKRVNGGLVVRTGTPGEEKEGEKYAKGLRPEISTRI